jgi:2-methylcitrate dehydratase PrpD
MTKRMHPGRAAQLGLESALLASSGFSGPTSVLEGRYGYLQAYSPRPEPARLTADLGHDWLSSRLTIKPYACHATSQAVVHAIQQIKPFDLGTLRRVVVRAEVEGRYLDRAPTTLLGAQYSLLFTTAVALVRDLSNPYAYDAGALADPLIRDLAGRVEIEPGASEIVIEFAGETRRLPAVDFPGSETRPLDFAAAADKLKRFAGRAPRVPDLIDLVGRLDTLEDVSLLASTIGA